ncbi:hypothetical protein VTN96DRAFT_2149 [Rasamsonia emersonii]
MKTGILLHRLRRELHLQQADPDPQTPLVGQIQLCPLRRAGRRRRRLRCRHLLRPRVAGRVALLVGEYRQW